VADDEAATNSKCMARNLIGTVQLDGKLQLTTLGLEDQQLTGLGDERHSVAQRGTACDHDKVRLFVVRYSKWLDVQFGQYTKLTTTATTSISLMVISHMIYISPVKNANKNLQKNMECPNVKRTVLFIA